VLLRQLGLAGVPELPSAPWQAAQTRVNFASPAARSGLGAAAGGAAGARQPGAALAGAGARRRCWAARRESPAGGQQQGSRQLHHRISFDWRKTRDSTMPLLPLRLP
jgi:hypothetical protein